jgi:hypothetical protein
MMTFYPFAHGVGQTGNARRITEGRQVRRPEKEECACSLRKVKDYFCGMNKVPRQWRQMRKRRRSAV